MTRILKLALMVSALLTLFGQTMALATIPGSAGNDPNASALMSVHCQDMMNGSDRCCAACDRMTLACVAGMGCATAFTLDQPLASAGPNAPPSLPPIGPPALALRGLLLQPDTHPPSRLD